MQLILVSFFQKSMTNKQVIEVIFEELKQYKLRFEKTNLEKLEKLLEFKSDIIKIIRIG